MSARPSLVRSIPFWILIAGSLAAIGFGLWLTTDKLGVMSATLTDGTATGLEVYVGQVWAIVGGILMATGLIGLALALVLGAVRSLLPAPAVAVVETVAWSDANDTADDEIVSVPVAVEPAAAAEPVVAFAEPAPAEPTAAETVPDEPTSTAQTAAADSESAPQR
ncbi:MAG: dinucleotide-utilizing enzyme [Microbacterium pygmaeum]